MGPFPSQKIYYIINVRHPLKFKRCQIKRICKAQSKFTYLITLQSTCVENIYETFLKSLI